jgi:SAM-dependent methyltransferase
MIRSIYRRVLPLETRIRVRGLISSVRGAPEQARIDRRVVASNYLRGEGIEIGALNLPLEVPPAAKVRYVDRLPVAALRDHYPELNSVELVNPDILADGELLDGIADSSQDFVIANHFIEHCQNPFLALNNMFRVLKVGGVIYMAVPDKRYTFDVDRPVTPVEHVVRDYEEGPAWSKRQHFEEWARFVNKAGDESQVSARADELMGIDYSIHFHVWTQWEMFDLLAAAKKSLGLSFDVELFLKNEHECVFVLRKEALEP